MSTQTHLVVPSPQDFAWTKVSESWVPVWMTIPEVSRSCSELVKSNVLAREIAPTANAAKRNSTAHHYCGVLL